MLSHRSALAALGWLAVDRAFAQTLYAPIETYERRTGGKVGLHAENLATGSRLVWRADERFVMCSTFKVSLVACVLSRVDRREDRLEAMIPFGRADLLDYAPVARQNLASGAMSVADMCKAAVELSDNACTNLLLARVGGPQALTSFWRSIGDSLTRLDHIEPELNRSPPGNPQDTTTPTAMAGDLRRLLLEEVLSAPSRTRLVEWMVNCQTGARRLRAGLPADWKIGDKTGNNGRDAAGDIAVAWPNPGTPILMAAYTQGGTPTAQDFDGLFAGIGRLIAHRLG